MQTNNRVSWNKTKQVEAGTKWSYNFLHKINKWFIKKSFKVSAKDSSF